jgi:hypothetical protein
MAPVVATGQAPSRALVDTIARGIVRTTSPGPTSWTGTNGWRLELERVIQPPDGTPGELGDPFTVQVLHDGGLLVVDQKAMAIKLFNANGVFVRTLGREGAGPGEYRAPQAVAFGDSTFVHDHMLSRGTVMHRDGGGVRTFPTTCCVRFAQVAVDSRGRFWVAAPGGSDYQKWVVLSPAGDRIDSLPERPVGQERRWIMPRFRPLVPLSPENRALVLRDGTLLLGNTATYQFWTTRTGMDTARTFRRTNVVAERAPTAVRESLFTAHTRDANTRAVASLGDIPTTYPLWREFVEDGGGNLWVLVGGEAGRPTRLDVFGPDGRFLGSVASPFVTLGWTGWSRDRVAQIGTDDNDLPLIRVYRIVRGGRT